ncbi:MAG TPA: carboxypeptidase regulatory-like domain-containing protein [Bacteroidota bacterium]|jgi:plastocyanin
MRLKPGIPTFIAASFWLFSGCGGEKPAPPRPAAAPQEQVQTPASVSCKILLEGTPPKMESVKMNADRKCITMHKEPVYFQNVLTNGKGMLRNAFVYVKEGLGSQTYPVPKEPVTIDQEGCMYHPHVMGIRVGQPLQVVNLDPVLHNIHALPKVNAGFNFAQPREGMKKEEVFSQPEIMVRVKCDVHSWMSAYVGVLDHPFFAVSDSNGACTLKNLPPGQYTLAAWHETFGTLEQKIVVAAGESKNVTFQFAAK